MSEGYAPARVLELRAERERLEERLAEITSDIDREVVGMLRDGVTGQEIARVCGWSKQRVSQLRRRALANAEPDLGPGEAEMALHRSQIAAKGGRAAAVSRRVRAETAELLEAYGIGEGSRGDALRFIARATSDELRPRSRDEAAAEWVALRAERRELTSV
jgi:hypothetical protein